MIKYIKARCGERSTKWGLAASLALLLGSFFVPYEYAEIGDSMRQIAIPLFVGMFLMEDKA